MNLPTRFPEGPQTLSLVLLSETRSSDRTPLLAQSNDCALTLYSTGILTYLVSSQISCGNSPLLTTRPRTQAFPRTTLALYPPAASPP